MVRGRYMFQPDKLSDAHQSCQTLFTQRASKGISPLVVDNTNMMHWEMYYYLQVAVQYGYHIEIMEPNTPWKFSEKKLALKNTHAVSWESISRMKNKYENGQNVKHILSALNLDVVTQPRMRSNQPVVKKAPKQPEIVKDLIDFELKPAAQEIQQKSYNPFKSQPLPLKDTEWQSIEQVSFQQVFEEHWSQPVEKVPPLVEKETPKKEAEPKPQPQRKKGKNKQNRSTQSKLMPHRKNCSNENPSFSQIRELYPSVNDAYLWDLFERCLGDPDWCANILYDENLTDQMDAGSDLSCSCGSDVSTRAVVNEPVEQIAQNQQQAQSSPTTKSRKAKTEAAKQIDLEDWLCTKELIEKSVTINEEHYPEHVKMVKNWKQVPTATPEVEAPLINGERSETPKISFSPDIGDELQALTISNVLIMELDEEYGGGCLKSEMDNQHKLPLKIFIKKSTAHQLYLEIMEAFYSQKEEARLEGIKNDEELAKQLYEQSLLDQPSKLAAKGSRKNNSAKDKLELLDLQYQKELNIWKIEESDDIALKISKDKLIEMFPGINKEMLMEVFAGAKHNFNETVELIQDSLNCTAQERKEIAQVQKKVFNTPWQTVQQSSSITTSGRDDENCDETQEGYTKDDLETVENLRQEINDHIEEQQVCYQKSRDAIQKKNYELATYLSNIANFHKLKAEEAKHAVASMMAGIHENTHKSDTTLDLHFFNLVEAATLLDTFLDKNISRLRAIRKPYEEIHIITGRGAHSANGIATIKNKTKRRLQERHLTYV